MIIKKKIQKPKIKKQIIESLENQNQPDDINSNISMNSESDIDNNVDIKDGIVEKNNNQSEDDQELFDSNSMEFIEQDLIEDETGKESDENNNQSFLEDKTDEEEIFSEINFDNINFSQREERRQGDRRRGYRRINERNLVSRAQEEANELRLQANKEGYDEGFQKGLDEARSSIEELNKSLIGFMDATNRIYDEVSNDILDMSIEMAKKIIKKEVETDRSVLLSVINGVLQDLSKEESRVILYVSPLDLAVAKNSVPEILESSQLEAKISVMSDENVDQGSVIVKTNNGIVDASFKTQFKILEEALKLM